MRERWDEGGGRLEEGVRRVRERKMFGTKEGSRCHEKGEKVDDLSQRK